MSRPVGRVLCARLRGAAVIHLGLPLPTASCGLPASIGRAALDRSRREPLAPLLTLLRVGFTEPPQSPAALVVSYTTSNHALTCSDVSWRSPVSGSCRRVEGFLAQVLQRRRNHGTFKLYRVDEKERPDLVERFGVGTMPTLVVVEDKIVRARLERPRGCREIESFLAPWLK